MNKNKIIFIISIFFLVVSINFVFGQTSDCSNTDGTTPNNAQCMCGTATCDSNNKYCCIFSNTCGSNAINDCIPKPEQTGQGTFSFNYNPQCLVKVGCTIKDGKLSCVSTGGTTKTTGGDNGGTAGVDTGVFTGGYPLGTIGGDTGTTMGGDNGGTNGGDNRPICEGGLSQQETLQKCDNVDSYMSKKFKSNKVLDTRDNEFCDSGDFPTDFSLSYETELLVFGSALRNNECWLLVEAQQVTDGYKPDFYVKLNQVKEYFDVSENNNEDEQEKPPKITNLIAEPTQTQIKLKWDINLDADFYIIYKKEDSENYRELIKLFSNEFTDIDLTPNTEYSYYVTSYNSRYDNPESEPVFVTAKTLSEQTKPSKVTNFIAESTETEITLKWDTNQDAEYYIIYKKDENNNFNELVKLFGTEYKETELTPNTEYTYSVVVYNDRGFDIFESEPEIITIKTKQSVEQLIPKITSFTKKSFTANTISLEWQTQGEYLYSNLLRHGNLLYSGQNKEYEDKNLEENKCYLYHLYIYSKASSNYTNETFCTKPEIQDITSFKKLYSTANTIYLVWEAESPYGEFELYRNDVLLYKGKELFYEDKNLEQNKDYTYKLELKRYDQTDSEIKVFSTKDDFTYIKEFSAVYDEQKNQLNLTWIVLGNYKESRILKDGVLIYQNTDFKYDDIYIEKDKTYTYELYVLGENTEDYKKIEITI